MLRWAAEAMRLVSIIVFTVCLYELAKEELYSGTDGGEVYINYVGFIIDLLVAIVFAAIPYIVYYILKAKATRKDVLIEKRK